MAIASAEYIISFMYQWVSLGQVIFTESRILELHSIQQLKV